MKHLKRSIFFKLTAIIIVISLAPVGFLTVNSINNTRDYITNESLTAYRSIASEYTSGLEYKLGYYYDLLALLSSNLTIQDALTSTSSAANVNMYMRGLVITNEVSKYLSSDRMFPVDGCIIYSDLPAVPTFHRTVTTIENAARENWYSKYLKNKDYLTYSKVNREASTLSIFEDIIVTSFYSSYYSDTLGFIKLDISTDTLFSDVDVRGNSESMMTCIVMDMDSNAATADFDIIYRNGFSNDIVSVATDAAAQRNASENYISINSPNDYYMIVTPVGYCSMYAVTLFPTDTELLHMRNNQNITLMIIILSALFVLMSSIIYSRSFTSRLLLLLSKMKAVEAGDTNVSIEVKENSDDEISNLYRGFNRMVSKLDETIKMNYVAELEKKEAQLHSLQLQINPHFLYNTLETIGAIAMSHQVYAICDISEKLGDMFRYATNKENRDLVTVTDEIEHVTNYVFIQKLRFQDLFEVYYNLDPALASCSMPRFVLQPIVENAILHGLKDNTQKGCLEISVFKEDGCCMITITDDGVGMTRLQVDYLNNYVNNTSDKISEVHRQSIGLKNVNTRIKLIYGGDYGISISSIKGSGTTVAVRLPLQFEENLPQGGNHE